MLRRYASQPDPGAGVEVKGLVPDSDRRPADVLSEAFGPGTQAIDVSVASPGAQNAGTDCCASRWSQKLAKYGPWLDHLANQGIAYRPFVISAFGRPHPDARRAVASLAHRVARRRGHCDGRAVESAIWADIAVALWRRNARQLRACLPDHGEAW